MSHFTVAVIHKPEQSVSSLLEPYEATIRVNNKDEEDIRRVLRITRQCLGGCNNLSDMECWQLATEKYKADRDGIMHISNPQGKWDWWELGGRWDGHLLDKSGQKVNSGRISDLSLKPREDVYSDSLNVWDAVVEGKNNGYYIASLSKHRDDLRKAFACRENFARTLSLFSTYAVITPDGEWHEPEKMEWYHTCSNPVEKLQKWTLGYWDLFLAHANPEWMLTIVSCHK